MRRSSGPVDHEGNTAASAVNLNSLDLRNTVSGSVDVAGDQDFFRFTAQHTGKVTISISRDAGLNTRWQLVNANGTLRNLTGSSVTLQVVAGRTYTFGVQGTRGLGEYDLTMQLTPSFTGLGRVSSRTVNNQKVGGERWYRFQAAQAGTLALMSKVPTGTGDVSIELYNSAMQKLGTSTGDCTDLLSVATSYGSAYYIRLVGTNSRVQLKLGCGAGASKIAGLKTASLASVGNAREAAASNVEQPAQRGPVVACEVASNDGARFAAVDAIHREVGASSIAPSAAIVRHREIALVLFASDGAVSRNMASRDEAFAGDECSADGAFQGAIDDLAFATAR